MATGDLERRKLRPASGGRRPRVLLPQLLILLSLSLGAAWLQGSRHARAENPRDEKLAEEESVDLPPLPGQSVTRSTTSPRTTARRPESPNTETSRSASRGSSLPGISRFGELRDLGGSFYHIYGPRLLSQALGLGDDSPIQVYGWIQNSFTGNPSRPANGINFGVNPNDLANRWMGNQYYLVVENAVERNDTVNIGFRVDSLFGNDWQFTHMHGLFDTSFQKNHFAGFDPAQFYAELHLPVLTPGGLEIRGGRWYTILGFETVPAATRPLLSVPYLFNYGQPFTHFGVLSTLHVSDRVKVYNGTVNGWDRWINERYRWGYIGGINWTSRDGRTSVSTAMVWGPNQFPTFLSPQTEVLPTGATWPPGKAGYPNPGYPHNDRTLFTGVVAHWWTDKTMEIIEADLGFEQNVPGIGPTGATRDISWYGLGHWLFRSIIQRDDYHVLSGVWRAEVFFDPYGARTGVADTYYETTLGLIYRPQPWLWVRPEVRYDWAQFGQPYNDGHSGSQFTIAFDVMVLF